MTGFAWTDDRVAELRQHFDANLTAGQIMQKMGGGLTRSAILGKLFRLGLRHDGLARAERTRQGIASAPRTPRTRTAPFRAPPVIPAPEAKTSPAATAADLMPTCAPVGLFDLTNETCRWPYREAPPFLFCGDPTADLVESRPYCPWHSRIAYTKSSGERPNFRMMLRRSRQASPTAGNPPDDPQPSDNWTTLGAAARNVVAGLKG